MCKNVGNLVAKLSSVFQLKVPRGQFLPNFSILGTKPCFLKQTGPSSTPFLG